MLNSEDPNPNPNLAIAYDMSFILFGNENEVQECEVGDAASELAGDIYDWVLDKWDGVSGGVASIGWSRKDGGTWTIISTLDPNQ